ncbi:MAG: hypothetical protein JXQ29_08405 [Planctomycetes bacterium]|nr:hypothetical protein [Planctomycetota bacterium]
MDPITVPERAAAQLHNLRKRRLDQAAQHRAQAKALQAQPSPEERAGVGWLALALGVPDDWAYDWDRGGFVPPKTKAR